MRPSARRRDRCPAEFQPRLCQLGVIHDRCGRSHASMSVRCCPKADKRADVLGRPLCAMCGRLRVGKAFLHVCRLVGAACLGGSHDRVPRFNSGRGLQYLAHVPPPFESTLSPHARRNPPPIEAAVPPYPACFGGVSRSQREAARSSSIAGGTHKPTSAWRTARSTSQGPGSRWAPRIWATRSAKT